MYSIHVFQHFVNTAVFLYTIQRGREWRNICMYFKCIKNLTNNSHLSTLFQNQGETTGFNFVLFYFSTSCPSSPIRASQGWRCPSAQVALFPYSTKVTSAKSPVTASTFKEIEFVIMSDFFKPAPHALDQSSAKTTAPSPVRQFRCRVHRAGTHVASLMSSLSQFCTLVICYHHTNTYDHSPCSCLSYGRAGSATNANNTNLRRTSLKKKEEEEEDAKKSYQGKFTP